MTNEQILELAKTCEFKELTDENSEIGDEYWGCWEEHLLKFARAIIEEHEKDRKHNLGKDEYFNSWRN